MQNVTFNIEKNNLNICCVILSGYDREKITALKKHNFRYYSKTRQWSKTGFNDLTVFENYLIAVFNNDTKTINKLEPKKADLKADLIKLSAIKRQSKNEYIIRRNNEKINEIEKNFDKGTAELICQYSINNKLDFWSMTTESINELLLNNIELLADIINYNSTNNISNCDYVNRIYNDGLPF